LLEVFGIDSTLLQKILPQIQIDPQKIQTRSWNTISAEELKLFPYLTNKEANIIVQYRKVHGPFTSMDAVRKIKGIRSDIPEKLTPYLHFEL
jgi:DNA uptake protein ComE-like DNA-binding protein